MTRGKHRGRAGNRGRGRRGRGGGQHEAAAYNGDIEIRLLANGAFLEKLASLDEHYRDLESDELPGHKLHLEHFSDVEELLRVFRDCADEDATAELAFPSALTKKQRASVHTMAEASGLGGLATFSRGFGEERYVSVMREGSQPRRELTEAQAHKAHFLWRFADEAGHNCSRDEVADMVLMDRIPANLGDLWKVKSAEQKTVIRLCEAAAGGKLDEVKAVITEFPDLVSNGVIDLMTGSAPLHAAARGGSAEAVKAVLDAGADIEARDGNGWTALRLARKHDHSDAEGVLLRAGARDPQAEAWPGGATRAPVSSALDAGGSSDAPQQESGSGSPAPDSHPHRGGDTESEHSVSQTGADAATSDYAHSIPPSELDPEDYSAHRPGVALLGVGVNEEDQEEEEERHIPDVASEAADGQQHEKEAEEDEQEAATANHLTEDGDDNSSLADVSRDTKRTVTFDVPDSPPASPLSSAPGDDHEAAASSGEHGEPEEDEPDAAQRGAEVQQGADGSAELPPAEDLPADEEPQLEAERSAGQVTQAEACLEQPLGDACEARSQAHEHRDSFEFRPPVGSTSPDTYPGFAVGIPKSESTQVLPPTSNAASSDTNDADSVAEAEAEQAAAVNPAIASGSFGSAADLVSIDSTVAEESGPSATSLSDAAGERAPPLDGGKQSVNSSSADAVKQEQEPPHVVRRGLGAAPVLPPRPSPRRGSRLQTNEINPMPQLEAQLSHEDEGEGTIGEWLPQPIADWAQWAYDNPSTVAYYGFGAATVGATLVWLMGGRRRR